MNRLHRSNNGLLAQELVSEAADIEVLIFPLFFPKRGTLLYLKSRVPSGTSFNLNETWHIHCGMTRLHRSNNGLLAQELVAGQQTSKY